MNYQTKFVYDRVVTDPKIKSVLNIGYRYDSDPTIMSYCLGTGKSWTALEVFEPNVKTLRENGINTIHMNVLDIANLKETYDAIIWLHGPEHILWEDFLKCRSDIESKSNYFTLYQTPVGEYPQDEIYGNPYEKHVVSLYPNMFSELGYNTFDHSPQGEKTFSAWIYK